MFADVKFSLIFFLGLLNRSRTLKIAMPFLRSSIRATEMPNFNVLNHIPPKKKLMNVHPPPPYPQIQPKKLFLSAKNSKAVGRWVFTSFNI